MPYSDLKQPVSKLTGVGPALASKLGAFGIFTLIDLLFHLPRQYQDRSRTTPLNQLQFGRFSVIEGTVLTSQVSFGKRRSLLCTIEDDFSIITLRFFHFSKSQQANFEQGRLIRCFGEVRQGPRGAEMVHPEYHFDPLPLSKADAHLSAIYPSTEGISQAVWRKLQGQAIAILKMADAQLALTELPQELSFLDCSLKEAMVFLHEPPNDCHFQEIEQGKHIFQQRLAFEELLAHQLSLMLVKRQRQQKNAPVFNNLQLAEVLLQALPFSLTGAQQRTFKEIEEDLEKNQPMLRLVQGDVGSGKTVIAALAAALAVQSGFQVAIMAPTEILAQQHKESFEQWFNPLDIHVDWLVGRHTKKQKSDIVARLESGETQIILATHAVFQDNVIFNKLGLVIIDEQHRFGVHQRLALQDKGQHENMSPHQLVMTATPIPRTLAMTAYADLNLSVIDELPPGRKPITTVALEQHRRDEIIERIKTHAETGQQVYWVCTLIEESETLNCRAAEETATELQQSLLPLSVGLVHGRLKAKEKSEVMERFAAGEIHVLVATTVIEVGVNVPNSTLMVIENPERLGLAQLHQLRGRIGRGEKQSHCVLLYKTPLSQASKERIKIMRETNDGFKIAETDLKLRGPGEVLGAKQTGLMEFRVADIERDNDLIPAVSSFAATLLNDETLCKTVIDRWIFNADKYAQA